MRLKSRSSTIGVCVLVVLAFCANRALAQTAACCIGNACQELEQTPCLDAGGTWHGDRPTPPGPILSCVGVTCPRPLNDDCANAIDLNAPGQPCHDQPVNPNLGRCDGSSLVNPDPDEGCILPDGDGTEDCRNAGDACAPWLAGGYYCEVGIRNLLASKDGPDWNGDCAREGSHIGADVWFVYRAPCTGRMSIRTCDDPTFDMMMAIYDYNQLDCPPTSLVDLITCDDDFCPGNSTSSGLSVSVNQDQEVLIRVGGWSSSSGATDADEGISEMEISVFCDAGPPLAPSAPFNAPKNRYLSFRPNSPAVSAAYRVVLPDARIAWIGLPQSVDWGGEDPAFVSLVVDSPVERIWDEDVIYVTGCAITPNQTYRITTVRTGGEVISLEYVVETVPTPTAGSWADIVGNFDLGSQSWTPPNGFTNFNDIDAAVKKFQALATAPHVTVVDLHPQWPNYFINFSDIDMVIKGFQGAAYPVPTSDCQTIANCPLGGAAACLP